MNNKTHSYKLKESINLLTASFKYKFHNCKTALSVIQVSNFMISYTI